MLLRSFFYNFTSMLSMTMTVHQLNMSWTVAAEKARRNSLRLEILIGDSNYIGTTRTMENRKCVFT